MDWVIYALTIALDQHPPTALGKREEARSDPRPGETALLPTRPLAAWRDIVTGTPVSGLVSKNQAADEQGKSRLLWLLRESAVVLPDQLHFRLLTS